MKQIDEMNKLLESLEERLKKVIAETEDIVDIHDVPLKKALKHQITLEHRWNPLKADVKKMVARSKFIEEMCYNDAVTGNMNDNYKSVKITEAKEFGKQSANYRKAKRLVIETEDMLDEVNAYMEIVTSRRYVLNNITNAMISGVENSLI